MRLAEVLASFQVQLAVESKFQVTGKQDISKG